MFSRAQDVRWPRLALRCAPAAADVETRRVRQRGALKSCSALYVKMDLQHGPLTKLALCVNKHSTLSGLLTLLLLLLLLLPLLMLLRQRSMDTQWLSRDRTVST